MTNPTDVNAELASLHAANRDLQRMNDAQQRLLRAIAAYAPVVLYAKDLAGRFVFSNRLHATLLGLRADEVVGKHEAELVGAEAAAEIQAITDAVVASGEPHVAEFNIPLDGESRVFLEHVFPLRDGGGRADGIGGAAIDISERKRGEQAARVLAAIAEHSPDGIVVRATDGSSPTLANPAVRRIFGLAADVPASQVVARLGDRTRGEVELVREDGEPVTLELTSFEIPDPQGEVGSRVTLIRDVTELRRAARERERQAEVIRRQQTELIAELGAPLLPLAPGVLVMPLIGSIDRERSEQLREAALEAVVRNQTRVLILDLTGMRAAGEAQADRLLAFIDAVGLIGARVLLTGIQPAIASALVAAGFAPRRGLTVLGTLQDAVREAFAALAGRGAR